VLARLPRLGEPCACEAGDVEGEAQSVDVVRLYVDDVRVISNQCCPEGLTATLYWAATPVHENAPGAAKRNRVRSSWLHVRDELATEGSLLLRLLEVCEAEAHDECHDEYWSENYKTC